MTTPSQPGPDQRSSDQPGTEQPDPRLDALKSERRQLFDVAYRLLGSLADAEDVVQETYARWYALTTEQQEDIKTPVAWMTKVASRICLDLLGSARARRERYVGEWIPEPLPDRSEWVSGRSGVLSGDPADRVTLDESISMAFLVVLESMTPAERVAFILHDVFSYPFADVAEIVGRSPDACRQLASSARRRVRESGSAATPAPHTRQADVVRQFKEAFEAKDVAGLVRLLDPQVVSMTDGGGVASAYPSRVGPAEVVQACLDLKSRMPYLSVLERTVNGQPGLVAQVDGETMAVLAFKVVDDMIEHIWTVRNPEKLRPWITS
ncbi:MAG: RNA polymerase sigma factor SigJ [Nocardioidaceae bacterium]